MKLRIGLAGFLLTICGNLTDAQRPRKVTQAANNASGARTLIVIAEPNAIVWLDEIRRGTTDQTGKLVLSKISSGQHTLRVRAAGFKEMTVPVLAAQRGEIKVGLLRTTDEAELTFQQAEAARETARDDEARQKAADLYRQTLKLRAAFPAAHVGLARVLMDLNDTNGALAEIESARRYRANYPEASAVEGRIYRETGQTDEAIGAFNRASRESHGFRPEAHAAIGRASEEKGTSAVAARQLRIASSQRSATKPANDPQLSGSPVPALKIGYRRPSQRAQEPRR